jgi:hypothetical protein
MFPDILSGIAHARARIGGSTERFPARLPSVSALRIPHHGGSKSGRIGGSDDRGLPAAHSAGRAGLWLLPLHERAKRLPDGRLHCRIQASGFAERQNRLLNVLICERRLSREELREHLHRTRRRLPGIGHARNDRGRCRYSAVERHSELPSSAAASCRRLDGGSDDRCPSAAF